MTSFFRTGLLLLLAIFLAACGGGGSSSASGSTTRTSTSDNTTPAPSEPSAGGGEIQNPPVAADLTSNIFFPVNDGMALYFSGASEPAMLGTPVDYASQSVYPLQLPEQRIGYVVSSNDRVALRGMQLPIIYGTNPLVIEALFDEPRTILGTANTYVTEGDAVVSALGVAGSMTVPVKVTATLAGNELLPLTDFAEMSLMSGPLQQPARKITVKFKWSATAAQILVLYSLDPDLLTLLDSLQLDLWFMPGVGIVKYQQGGLGDVVVKTSGIPQPLAFSFTRNIAVASLQPQQIELDGELLTDAGWQPTIYYRTPGVDWLDVSFDETGSWRARITRTGLAVGIYAATVRMTKDDVSRDVTVSMMVR